MLHGVTIAGKESGKTARVSVGVDGSVLFTDVDEDICMTVRKATRKRIIPPQTSGQKLKYARTSYPL